MRDLALIVRSVYILFLIPAHLIIGVQIYTLLCNMQKFLFYYSI